MVLRSFKYMVVRKSDAQKNKPKPKPKQRTKKNKNQNKSRKPKRSKKRQSMKGGFVRGGSVQQFIQQFVQ
jgi:hypothetical protein